MKRQRQTQRNIARCLSALALTLVGLMTWVAPAGSTSSRRTPSGSAVFSRITPGKVKAWSTNGPEVDIQSLAIALANPNIIYAGSGSRVFKSTDGGANWSSIGLLSNDVNVLAVDPGNPNTVYAMTIDGVFKSMDGGAAWSAINDGLPSPASFADMVIAPTNPGALYIATNTERSAGALDGGVFKSTDGGASWSSLSGAVTFDSRGLLSSGVPAVRLLIVPNDKNIIYAAGYYDPYGGLTLFKGPNGGASWNSCLCDLAMDQIGPLAIDPEALNVVYAGCSKGVCKSTDGGTSWSNSELNSHIVLSNSDISALLVDPGNPNILYAGTLGSGVFKSPDAGASWTEFNTGLTNLFVNALALDSSGTHLHAATRAGVFDFPTASPIPVPKIDGALVDGKRLIVVGENFDTGALILVNGEVQKTTNDGQHPQTTLVGKKAGKGIQPGARIQVRNPGGALSEEFVFTGS